MSDIKSKNLNTKKSTESNACIGDGIDTWRKIAETGANIDLNVRPSGVSMRPLIRGGRDKVIVRPLRREVLPGDIVLFIRKDGANVMHRVYNIQGDKITTYGDGCWYADEPIKRDDIVGIATVLYRAKGKSSDSHNYRKINLDTDKRRKQGLLWLKTAPVRRVYYRIRNIMHSVKRKIINK